MLRVNAVPGNMPLGDQRRGGSPSQSASLVQQGRPGSFRPSSWSRVITRAPAFSTRRHSSALRMSGGLVRGDGCAVVVVGVAESKAGVQQA